MKKLFALALIAVLAMVLSMPTNAESGVVIKPPGISVSLDNVIAATIEPACVLQYHQSNSPALIPAMWAMYSQPGKFNFAPAELNIDLTLPEYVTKHLLLGTWIDKLS